MSLAAQPLGFDNPWVRDVDAARRPARGWALGLVALLVAVLAVTAARRLAETLVQAAPNLGPLAIFAAATALAFMPLWLAALVGGAFERRPVWLKGAGGLDAGLGLAAGGVGYAMALVLVAAGGHLARGAEGQGAQALVGVLAGFGLVALQASAEEVFFRGWLQPVLCARWGVWVGLLATSLLFALLHLLGGERSATALLNLLLGGLAFGLFALRTGGLWAPVCAHFAWNWVEACVLGLDTNPGVGPTGSLFDLDLVGAPLWSGGEDGMNGSLALTVVLAACVGALTAWRAKPLGALARA